jgi:Potential Queuosine, Q, salvage protein family
MKSLIRERRRFLTGLAGSLAVLPWVRPFGWSLVKTSISDAKENSVRWPILRGSPVLDSLRPVIENSRDVRTNIAKIVEVAGWMGYEELPLPEFTLPFGVGAGDPKEAIDFILVADSIDTAFTDFLTHEKFQVNFAGQHWSDSDAEFACLKRALDAGKPLLDGRYLAKISSGELDEIFAGNMKMPMLDEKLAVLHQVGAVLAEKYDGRFHKFVEACSPQLYDGGNGLIERMVKEFPRFNDVSEFEGHEIKFYKLAQLGVWMLYSTLHKSGKFRLDDPEKMTAFADYIVPVGLRLLGITSYSPELENAINSHQLIPRDSRREVEIRAHCIYATALLAEEVNKVRGPKEQVIIPQIDARLWTHYHTTSWPHHLTQTIMY